MKRARWPRLDRLFGPRKQPFGPPAKIILGLGNPGDEYAGTRHNVGFRVVDLLARKHSLPLGRKHRAAWIGEGLIAGQPVTIAKPRTFVNRSGEAAISLLARYRVSPQDLLVICDDMDLPPGKIRVRAGGGSGGHNGIKSISEALRTEDFPRIRIGIGRPTGSSDSVEHVLGNLPSEEQALLNEAVERATDAAVIVLTEGVEAAMNHFN